MSGTKFGLAAMALVFSVGCGGARIGQLESELGACKENKESLSAENARLQDANGKLQTKADELAKLAAARKALHDDLQAALLALIDAGQLKLSIRNGMVTLALPSQLLFNSGKADVTKDGKATLLQVAAVLKNVQRKFLIAGHTDNRSVKEKKARFRDNWELSSARAYSVYTLLTAAAVAPANLAVAGFGDADPVADNGTEEGQAANRRVEIVVMLNMDAVLPAMAQVKP